MAWKQHELAKLKRMRVYSNGKKGMKI